MADKPIREQSALELLETHAKALEGYCMENARLRAALKQYVDFQIGDYYRQADAAKRYCEIRREAVKLLAGVETTAVQPAEWADAAFTLARKYDQGAGGTYEFDHATLLRLLREARKLPLEVTSAP